VTTSEVETRIAEMRKFNADLTHVEAKAATTDLPHRAWETVSAFSNTPRGGLLILGVAEREGFRVVGVRNPAKIQHDLANLCSSEMEPVVWPTIQLHEIEGKPVVTAVIPELPSHLRPCYYREAGYTNGAFIRVAHGDRKLTAYEVQMMLSARNQPKDDQEAVPDASINDLQPRLVKTLLTRLRKRPGSPLARMNDRDALRTLKVLTPYRNRLVCTLGGLIALGKYPQQFFPALAITFVAYPGDGVGEPGANDERFLDNHRIEGAIPDMLGPVIASLERNMKRRSVVRGMYREDLSAYPVTALREAIINAVAHRDLSNAAKGTPVQIHVFRNRLVIHNPGGLYGPLTVDSLGQGISATRNSALLRILEDVTVRGERQAVCENRGSGVGAMLNALRRSGLPKPIFEDRIAMFRVTFLYAPLTRRRDRRDHIVALLQQHGSMSRAELSQALELSDIAVRKWLAQLREEGTIITTEAKAKSKNVRYQLTATEPRA
jgi:ATP-dependent DNA helicase RecG